MIAPRPCQCFNGIFKLLGLNGGGAFEDKPLEE